MYDDEPLMTHLVMLCAPSPAGGQYIGVAYWVMSVDEMLPPHRKVAMMLDAMDRDASNNVAWVHNFGSYGSSGYVHEYRIVDPDYDYHDRTYVKSSRLIEGKEYHGAKNHGVAHTVRETKAEHRDSPDHVQPS